MYKDLLTENGIHNKSVYILIIIFIAIITIGSAKKSEEKPWIFYAYKFLEADMLMISNADKSKQVEYYNLRKESEKQLNESNPPEIQDIEKLINSNEFRDQAVACVGIMVFKIYSNRVIESIIINLRKSETYERKRYYLLALREVEQNDLAPFEKDIFREIEKEEDPRVLAEGLLLLSHFSPEKVTKVINEILLNKGDAGTKRIAYAILTGFGRKYAEYAKDNLKSKGAFETLEIIMNLEKGEEGVKRSR